LLLASLSSRYIDDKAHVNHRNTYLAAAHSRPMGEGQDLFGRRKNGDAIVGALVFVVVCAASWLACHWFAGRAAFLLVGAMIGLHTGFEGNVTLHKDKPPVRKITVNRSIIQV
jgi:hypothetical protein